jgi:hypothetical protein
MLGIFFAFCALAASKPVLPQRFEYVLISNFSGSTRIDPAREFYDFEKKVRRVDTIISSPFPPPPVVPPNSNLVMFFNYAEKKVESCFFGEGEVGCESSDWFLAMPTPDFLSSSNVTYAGKAVFENQPVDVYHGVGFNRIGPMSSGSSGSWTFYFHQNSPVFLNCSLGNFKFLNFVAVDIWPNRTFEIPDLCSKTLSRVMTGGFFFLLVSSTGFAVGLFIMWRRAANWRKSLIQEDQND